jgi:predicted transcriptional regulator
MGVIMREPELVRGAEKLTTYVTPQLKAKLAELARRSDRSVASEMRQALAAWVKDRSA